MRKPLLDDGAAIIETIEKVPLFQCRGGGVGADQLSKQADVSCVVAVLDDGPGRQLLDDGDDGIASGAENPVELGPDLPVGR